MYLPMGRRGGPDPSSESVTGVAQWDRVSDSDLYVLWFDSSQWRWLWLWWVWRPCLRLQGGGAGTHGELCWDREPRSRAGMSRSPR